MISYKISVKFDPVKSANACIYLETNILVFLYIYIIRNLIDSTEKTLDCFVIFRFLDFINLDFFLCIILSPL